MTTKITRRIALGTIIGGLAVGPFVIRYFRRGDGLIANFAKEKKEYLDSLSFPREYGPGLNPYISPNDHDTVIQIHKRYWSNFAKLRKTEFDYTAQRYAPGGIKMNDFWDMSVRVKMEYGQGFEIKGKDSTGHNVDVICTREGTLWREARVNAGVATLMRGFFDTYMARPEMGSAYSEIRKGVEMMPNPYINGRGLYDILVLHDPPLSNNSPRPKRSVEKLDYYSRETGMLELRYVYHAPGVSYGRGVYEGSPDTATETFYVSKYDIVNSIYLTSMTTTLCPQTKYRREALYSNFTNVDIWPNS